MKRDQKRKPGFYWIRFEGKPTIGEWDNGLWYVCGVETAFGDSEVCELMSGKLKPSEAH